MPKPDRPVVFNKQITCVTGPSGPIEVPTVAPDWVDYEGELGVVIGQRCRSVKAADAPDVVAGYLVVNDVSVRDWQRATPDDDDGQELGHPRPDRTMAGHHRRDHRPARPPDPHVGRRRAPSGRVDAQMINNCWELIEHLSTAFTLLPGTIIATGTPAGVGFVMDPPRCLSPGSTVRIEIESIGTIENPVIAQP